MTYTLNFYLVEEAPVVVFLFVGLFTMFFVPILTQGYMEVWRENRAERRALACKPVPSVRLREIAEKRRYESDAAETAQLITLPVLPAEMDDAA